MLVTLGVIAFCALLSLGLTAKMKGRMWSYIRLALLVVAGVSVVGAGGLFLLHEGWDVEQRVNPKSRRGKGKLESFIAALFIWLGPKPTGVVFSLLGIYLLKTAYARWLVLKET